MNEEISTEEHFLEAIDGEDEEDEASSSPDWRERQRHRFQRKNQVTIDEFLGHGNRTYATGILPKYYSELLTWALHQYLERYKWTITHTLGYRGLEPFYSEVNTGSTTENLITNGQILIEKGDSRFSLTVDVDPRWRGTILLEGPVENKEEMTGFIAGVLTIAEKENFYRGKKVEFSGRLRFLDVQGRSWNSIILDAETKMEIKANTIDFLKRGEQWNRYGIPLKRGILLAGEPGTGKTIICKALMAEAEGITCITTSAYALDADDYITELYELAEDLRPSIVFLEDIDLIGLNRMEFGYQRGPALLSLLAVLDGVEVQKEIVTVATTNLIETLDKALSQRPSRFDRVIKIACPSLEQRRQFVRRLCERIPLCEEMQEYMALKTEGCTPAQLQEIVFSLVIKCPAKQYELTISRNDIDRAIIRINDRNKCRLGFTAGNNHNGKGPVHIDHERLT